MSNPEVNEFNSTVYISYIDNDYTNGWTNEQKINAFFTKEGEGRGF